MCDFYFSNSKAYNGSKYGANEKMLRLINEVVCMKYCLLNDALIRRRGESISHLGLTELYHSSWYDSHTFYVIDVWSIVLSCC